MLCFSIASNLKLRKFFEIIKRVFGEIYRILHRVRAGNLETTLLFVDFSKAFVFLRRRKVEQILLAYGLPKETVAAIMMLNKNMKEKSRSPDSVTHFFDIVAGVLQGDTFSPYLFIICQDYILRTSIDPMKENGFTLKKQETDDTPAQNIIDDIVLQTHLLNPNPWCIVWSRQQVALSSTWMQIKRSVL